MTTARTYDVCRAVLTSGSAHDDVHALGQLLAAAGFENSTSRGENPFGIVDGSILDAVNALRSTQSIEEEADIPGVPHEQRRNWIGPNLWDALLTPAGKARPLKATA